MEKVFLFCFPKGSWMENFFCQNWIVCQNGPEMDFNKRRRKLMNTNQFWETKANLKWFDDLGGFLWFAFSSYLIQSVVRSCPAGGPLSISSVSFFWLLVGCKKAKCGRRSLILSVEHPPQLCQGGGGWLSAAEGG